MRRLFAALLALAMLTSVSAHAAPAKSTPMAAPAASTSEPDLISFAVGYMDFDKSEPKRQSADFRLEYRFGYTFIGGKELGFHPFLGFETTSRNMMYGLGGFAMDWNFMHHGIFTWSEGVGYLDSGDMKSMGGTLQFRSQAELGYRFDNDMRITAEFSHISNAKLTRVNPGAEILGVYVHVPTNYFFGH